jgi:hypothetical protein
MKTVFVVTKKKEIRDWFHPKILLIRDKVHISCETCMMSLPK